MINDIFECILNNDLENAQKIINNRIHELDNETDYKAINNQKIRVLANAKMKLKTVFDSSDLISKDYKKLQELYNRQTDILNNFHSYIERCITWYVKLIKDEFSKKTIINSNIKEKIFNILDSVTNQHSIMGRVKVEYNDININNIINKLKKLSTACQFSSILPSQKYEYFPYSIAPDNTEVEIKGRMPTGLERDILSIIIDEMLAICTMSYIDSASKNINHSEIKYVELQHEAMKNKLFSKDKINSFYKSHEELEHSIMKIEHKKSFEKMAELFNLLNTAVSPTANIFIQPLTSVESEYIDFRNLRLS